MPKHVGNHWKIVGLTICTSNDPDKNTAEQPLCPYTQADMLMNLTFPNQHRSQPAELMQAALHFTKERSRRLFEYLKAQETPASANLPVQLVAPYITEDGLYTFSMAFR